MSGYNSTSFTSQARIVTGGRDLSKTLATAVRNVPRDLQEVESERHESKHSLKWTINDFCCSTVKTGENLPSIKFEFQLDANMFFEGYLSICGENCAKRKCSLELKNTSDKFWKVCCEIKINEDTSFATHLTQDQTFVDFSLYDRDYDDCWFKDHISNVVRCEIVHVTYKQIEQPSLICELQTPTLQTDFEQLFESKKMSDVTFEVAGQNITAHKLILASRSKFFADMFEQHDKEGTATPNIIIKDTEPDVFNEILRFIYTDNLRYLPKMPKNLLIASEKYGLAAVKSMCETELAEKINIENASELLILADENAAKRLKQHSVDFIKKRCKAVAETVGWQNIMKNKLHLLAELYVQIIE